MASVLSATLSVLVSTILSFSVYVFQGSAWLVAEQCSSPSLHTTALDWNINQPSQPSKAVNERPAVAGFPRPPVEASPWCSTHTYTHMHIRTITPTRRVMWTKEMQLPARVRLREQSSKLCPHSWRRMWWERHSLSFTRNTHSQRSNSQAPPTPPFVKAQPQLLITVTVRLCDRNRMLSLMCPSKKVHWWDPLGGLATCGADLALVSDTVQKSNPKQTSAETISWFLAILYSEKN